MYSNYKVDLLILFTLISLFSYFNIVIIQYIRAILRKLRVKFYIINPFLPPVSFPSLHPVAYYCILLLVVACCCLKFETGQMFISYAQTEATTPNNVRPTMLGVVASACT